MQTKHNLVSRILPLASNSAAMFSRRTSMAWHLIQIAPLSGSDQGCSSCLQKPGGTAFPACSGSPWGQERTSLTTVSPRFYGIWGTKNHYPEPQRSLLAAWVVGNDGPRLSSGKKGCGHLKNVSISVTPTGGPQAAKGASAHSRELRPADPPCPTRRLGTHASPARASPRPARTRPAPSHTPRPRPGARARTGPPLASRPSPGVCVWGGGAPLHRAHAPCGRPRAGSPRRELGGAPR